jgi:predicted DNA-binding transcriptional regulator AlpA
MAQNEIDLLSTKQVAELLGVTDECLVAWRRTGNGPAFIRIGTRKVAYDRRDVTSWLEGQRNKPVVKAVA